jgi:hypothetical protein
MEILTNNLGLITIDTSNNKFSITYDPEKKTMFFFNFINVNKEELLKKYSDNKEIIKKIIEDYNVLRKIAETHLVNKMLETDVRYGVYFILELDIINEINNYLLEQIENLELENWSDAGIYISPNLSILLSNNPNLLNKIKKHITKNFGDIIIKTFHKWFAPPDLWVNFDNNEVKIQVTYETEKRTFCECIDFYLTEKYEVIRTFFDWPDHGQ